MPINAGFEYGLAEQEYINAKNDADRLKALQNMLSQSPSHKGAEKLRSDIKQKISKLRSSIEKQKKSAKSSGGSSAFSVKKEGAAQIVLVGVTNSGKSTLLRELTRAQVEIAPYPFTTKKPEVGTLDYYGIKLQIVEIPAIVPHFEDTQYGPALLSVLRQADLMILLFHSAEEKAVLDRELHEVHTSKLIFNHQAHLADEIWKRLPLIKVYTKQPGKEKDYPPIAFPKGTTVEDVAKKVHKDFVERFRFARIFGTSVKFLGAQVGIHHILADGDIVEFHLR